MMHRSKAQLCHAASPCTQECSWASTHPASQRCPGVVCRLVLSQLLLCDLAGPDPTCHQAVSVTQCCFVYLFCVWQCSQLQG